MSRTTATTRTALLTAATTATIVAAWATTDRWAHGDAAEPLRTTALLLWTLTALNHHADRHLTHLKNLRDEIAAYGQTRYNEGALDTATHQHHPPAPNLRHLR